MHEGTYTGLQGLHRSLRYNSPARTAATASSESPGLVLPPSDFSRIQKAVYVGSSVDIKGCPPEKYPEFAVIGRSNVGKSSLINMLTQDDKLAKVSKEPGQLHEIYAHSNGHEVGHCSSISERTFSQAQISD
jgi:hypothetical protein